jgi:hypothetical protein
MFLNVMNYLKLHLLWHKSIYREITTHPQGVVTTV